MSYNFVLPPVPRYLRPEDRFAIECQIEALIELLDQDDGDPDLEPEEDFGVCDVPHDQEHPLIPAYGIDQGAGPINHATACQIYDLTERMRDYELAGMSAQANKVAVRLAALNALP